MKRGIIIEGIKRTWTTARARNWSSLRVSWCHSFRWYRSASAAYHSASSGRVARCASRNSSTAVAIVRQEEQSWKNGRSARSGSHHAEIEDLYDDSARARLKRTNELAHGSCKRALCLWRGPKEAQLGGGEDGTKRDERECLWRGPKEAQLGGGEEGTKHDERE
jgi:hypothetical protein